MVALAPQPMSAMQRNGLWGFIALLAALAFLRSLAPDYSAGTVRGLLKVTDSSASSETDELRRLRDDVKRETVALERLRDEMDNKRDLIKQYEQFQKAEREKEHVSADEVVVYPPANDHDSESSSTGIESTSAPSENKQHTKTHDDNESQNGYQNKDPSPSDDAAETTEGEFHLSDGECPKVIAIESSKSGLGTQIEHIISMLSLSLAVQNACVVLPPINAQNGLDAYRPVAFGEIFDEEEFAGTAVRTIPLSMCKTLGVSDVFDDSGAESAILKNFAAFARETNPELGEGTTLVHKETAGHRFENSSIIGGDVTVMAKYIGEKIDKKTERTCIGLGRMRAEVAPNPDVLEHLRPVSSIAEYVSSKFPKADELMFVKLRWNKMYCDSARTEPGTICMYSDVVLPTEEYAKSIAFTAQQTGATSIYMSIPSHVPDDVSEYLAENLITLEPVLLDVEGNLFTANLIEHELAIRSNIFVPDGGAWGNTVQLLRSSRNTEYYREEFDSRIMVQEWKDAGSPADSYFLTASGKSDNMKTGEPEQASETEDLSQEEKYESPAKLESELESMEQREGGEEVVNFLDADQGAILEQVIGENNAGTGEPQSQSTDAENRPQEYVPPQEYIPNEETDDHLFRNSNDARTHHPDAEPARNYIPNEELSNLTQKPDNVVVQPQQLGLAQHHIPHAEITHQPQIQAPTVEPTQTQIRTEVLQIQSIQNQDIASPTKSMVSGQSMNDVANSLETPNVAEVANKFQSPPSDHSNPNP